MNRPIRLELALVLVVAVVLLAPVAALAQVCVACGCSGCTTLPITCPSGQVIQVTGCTCQPDMKTMTVSSPGKASYQCACCDNSCGSETQIRSRFCTAAIPTPQPTPSPFLPGGPITTAAPAYGTPDLTGPEQGAPFFSRNSFLDGESRRQDVGTRSRTLTGAKLSTSRPRALWGERDGWHRQRRKTPGCFSVSQAAKFSYFSALPLTATAEGSGESTWPPIDPLSPLPMIGPDEGLSQSIGGVGITVGAPDTPPPPSPQTVNRPEECNKGWYFKPDTRTCYFSQTSCGNDCLAPPNPDPALGPGGHVNKPGDCPRGSYYNNGNRSCYPSSAECQSQLQPQAGTTCTVPNP